MEYIIHVVLYESMDDSSLKQKHTDKHKYHQRKIWIRGSLSFENCENKQGRNGSL